jgi:tetratricopeptide (TPR) repeat protein
VNVQLIDAETDNHLWAERFDKAVADLFDLQDEVVARLANALSAQLVAAEARRAEQTPTPDSMDLYFQGMAWLNKGATPEDFARARTLFERALALDPANVNALVGVARVDLDSGPALASADRAARLASAEAAAAKALSLAPDDAGAHVCMGSVLNFSNRAAQSIAEHERALALDRNFARAHALIGFAKTALGRAAETEAHIQEAFRLSPRDSRAHAWAHIAAGAKLQLEKDEEAVAWERRSIEFNRNHSMAHLYLAAALAQLGKLDEARAAAMTGLALDTTFTIGRFRANNWSDNPVYLAGRERMYEGMRKAGVPEG